MLIDALPPAAPPARVVAGVTVTWPLSKPVTSVAPGASLTVRIASRRRAAKVSFVRVNAEGRGLGLVAAKTLRKGSFTVKVPQVDGARFALRLTVAGHKRWSWVTTPPRPAPVDQIATPVPSATPTPTPLPFCGPEGELPDSAFRARVDIAAATISAGSTLSYTVVNVGEGKIALADEIALLREGDGTGMIGPSAATPLAPGASLTRGLTIPAGTPPGRYYLSQTVTIAQCDYIYPRFFNSPGFEVTP